MGKQQVTMKKKQALVESHGDEIKVWTESQDENRAKALPPFPVFRHKGIGCSEAPKLKERKKFASQRLLLL